MTRKDYVMIANVVNKLVDGLKQLEQDNPKAFIYTSLVRELVNNFSDELHKDNPRFSRDKFWEACGL